MKKFTAKIIAIALSLVCLFSFASCAEVENGSKIEYMTITISLTDAEGTEIKYDVRAKMYLNFADFTVEHVKGLIEGGHYNNVDVSALTSTYFSFGDRKLDLTAADPLAERIDTNVKQVKGQFVKNGYTGNKLTLVPGAILLNRADKAEGEATTKYNTGKSTLTVSLATTAPFNPQEYCIFAQILSDDGNKEADSSSDEYLSSLDKVKKIQEYITTSDDARVYRLEKDIIIDETLENAEEVENNVWKAGTCFTYAKNSEGDFTYFYGVHLDGVQNAEEVEGEQLSALKSKITASGNAVTIPVLNIKVSISLDKQGCAR